MKKFFVKALSMLLVCVFVVSGINFAIFTGEAADAGNLGDKLVAMNVELSGKVKMLLYFTNVEGNVDYYVVNVDGASRQVQVDEMVKDAKGRHVLEIPLVAAQQALKVSVTPYAADGTAGKTRSKSITDYVTAAIEQNVVDEKGVVALESMLNYGAMAQLAFGKYTDNLANEGLYFGSTNPVYNMSISDMYGIKESVKTATSESNLSFTDVNGYLESSVSMRYYLNYQGDYSKLKITIDGLYCGNDVFYDEDADKYYALIDNIPATKYNHQYTITVTDGTYTATIKYSVLNYLTSFIQTSNDQNRINAAYAMFGYYVKMHEYAHPSEEVVGKPSACSHNRSYVDAKTYRELCSDCGKDISHVGSGESIGIVDNANDLANGVTSYFGTNDGAGGGNVDGLRENYVVENDNMSLYYPLAKAEPSETGSQLATITNKTGGVYVQDTMDVYVTTSNGTYYASKSSKDATANIYRYGHYYYDIHAYGQNFLDAVVDESSPSATSNFALSKFVTRTEKKNFWGNVTGYSYSAHVSSGISCTEAQAETAYNSGVLAFSILGGDPYIQTNSQTLFANTGTYNAVQITMTVQSTTSVDLRYTTKATTDWKAEEIAGHMVSFETIADGSSHTYTVYFNETVDIFDLRLDFNGQVGENITITSIDFVTINLGGAPKLLLDRGLHTYTDKMHQILSIVAPYETVGDIQEIGMTTNVTATKIYIVQKDGTITQRLTASNNTKKDVVYAGFLTSAGVFGYILPYGDDSSTITVTRTANGKYTITQTVVPENNTIEQQPSCGTSTELAGYKQTYSSIGTSLNIYNSPTQFYFGQRIYTDTESTFDKFIEEAYIERNPLTAGNIKINTEKTPDATFDGYDGYRGMYAFTIPENIGFNAGYYYAQNFHGAVSFSVTGDSYNRNMYVMAYSYGCSVEGGAVLDKDDTLLPIQTEVAKNFNHEFEEPIWLWGDVGYCEVRIPVYVNAGETEELTVLQTYMNWGQYPLKQISSIQFFAPYYHLSTGVTESNCIANYYVHGKDLQTLPDHRAASAPFWSEDVGDKDGDGIPDGDPQHNNAGFHLWLQYTDSAGNKNASEPVSSVINSSGLTYADIDMTYISDDNKIKVTYTHMEMPQTDENRAYYEMKYTILEDVTINDFANNFSFYSVYGYGQGYTKFGYWGTSGAVNGKSADTAATYTLGSDYPYFDLYSINNKDSDGNENSQNANTAFLIGDCDFSGCSALDGKSFIVNVANRTATLSLNAGNVTLNAGDTFVIYAVVMPWGNYDSTNDALVQTARANTLVNPIVATAGENATVDTSSKFLPTIKTTNGLDATFTIGHRDSTAPATRNNMGVNVTFRVDGFKVLTTPKLYEQINGEWVLQEISSINTPDGSGNAHNYDGYFVHYDAKSGTYSYSFVTNINGSSRTFKVLVDDTYVDFTENHSDIYYDANSIYSAASYGSNLSTSTVQTENGITYVTLTNTVESGDAYTKAFKTVGGSAAKYLVIKYRTTSHSSGIQLFMNTNGRALDGDGDDIILANSIIDKSGEWKVMVLDLTSIDAEQTLTQMVESPIGTYSIVTFRLDPFTSSAVNETIDISYIGFCRELQTAIDWNSDMDISDISYVTGIATSEPIQNQLDQIQSNEKYKDMSVVFTGDSLADIMTDSSYDADITSATVNGDGTVTVKYGSTGDAYFGFTTSQAAGKYLVMKYKTADGVTNKYTNSSFYALAYDANGTYTEHAKTFGAYADGEWHTVVLDLTKLGNGVTTGADGQYYVTAFRADLFDSFSASGTVYFEYIGLCDEISDIPVDVGEFVEYGADYKNNVDAIYADGDEATNLNESVAASGSLTATTVKYVGWAGVGNGTTGFAANSIYYVVTDAEGNETKISLTASESGDNVYYERSDITEAVASLGTGTVGYVVKFVADLSKWNGQTVTISIREAVDGGAAVKTYSVTVNVPKAEAAGYINGSEIYDKASTTDYDLVLNNDGSVTITAKHEKTDAYVVMTEYAANVTPKYAVIKYKTASDAQITCFAATTSDLDHAWANYALNTDGQWHTLVIDLTKTESYNHGDAVSYFRLDLCETNGESITIDHIYLCENLYEYTGELVEPIFGNNVDELYADGNNETNLNAESAITATTVYYKGWLRASGFSAESISYVITDAHGNETIVPLTLGAADTGVTNTYYERTDVTNDSLGAPATWSVGTVGYGVIFEADLSEWIGQTVTLSIRETIADGAIVETYSVEVTVPGAEFDVIFEGEDLVNMMTGNGWDAGITNAVLNDDGTVTVSYDDSGDKYFGNYITSGEATGQYLVIKYRTGLDVTAPFGQIYCLASTTDASYTNHLKVATLVADHKWHILVIDLADLGGVNESDGKYYIDEFRADFFDALSNNGTVDFAYVGLCDNLGDVALGSGEHLELGWQNWQASLDSITVNGAAVDKDNKDGANNVHLGASSGASDRSNSYRGKTWGWSGWFSIDGKTVTDVSVCVTDENGVEYWTSFGAPSGRSDLNNNSHAENELGYAAGTLCYSANVSATLTEHHGQTVSVSVRALTEDGYAVTLYSVFVDVPAMQKNTWSNLNKVSVNDDLYTQITNQGNGNYTTTFNEDGTVTFTKSTALNTESYFTIMGNTSGAEKVVTGKYLVIKYRTEAASLVNGSIYAGSTNYGAVAGESFAGIPFHNDGQWHVVAIDLTKSSAVTPEDGVYKVNYARIDLAYALAAGETIDYGYIGFCDDLSDIDASDTIFGAPEVAGQYQLAVDNIGDTGGTTAGLIAGNHSTDISRDAGTTGSLSFIGWIALDGYSYTNVAYTIVADGVASEMTVIENSAVYEEGVYNAGVNAYGDDTNALRVKFGTTSATAPAISLSAYAGKTVTVYLAVANVVDGEIESMALFQEITVDVPYDAKPGYNSGAELQGVLSTGKFSGSLNDDGSLTITSTAADGDGAITLTDLVEGTPRYAVIKYKTTSHGTNITLLATTEGNDIGGYIHSPAQIDGEWHILVLDLTKCTGYNHGDAVSFMRLDICEGASGYNMTIDYVYLCEDLSEIAGELVDTTYSNNNDFLYVNGSTATNYRGNSSITGTSVQYTGWIAVNGFSVTEVSYVVTNASGNETVVPCSWNLNRTDITSHVINNSGYASDTVGCGGEFNADLSTWNGQTVTLSIRVTTNAGFIVETFSVTVNVQ